MARRARVGEHHGARRRGPPDGHGDSPPAPVHMAPLHAQSLEEHRVLGPRDVFRLLQPAVAVDSRGSRVRGRRLALRRAVGMKLLAFFLLAVVVHGPLSPLLPTAFETTLLYYVRFLPVPLLALVGTLGASLSEALNYRLVDWAVELPKLAALKQGRWVRWSIEAFLRAPFWTTAVVIFSPIPDFAVRILAPLGKYPLPKFLAAVALGRFPRLLLIVGFGVLVPIPAWLLLGAGLVLVVVGLGRRHALAVLSWLRKRRGAVNAPLLGPISGRME